MSALEIIGVAYAGAGAFGLLLVVALGKAAKRGDAQVIVPDYEPDRDDVAA